MDIVVWLRSLGFGKYEAAFRENEIDETVLPSLTEEHLKQLGVAAFGHRVKLPEAIAALRNEGSGRRPPLTQRPRRVSQAPLRRPRRTPPSDGDVLGPCGLYRTSACMDPEDLREVISAYQKCVAETVQRFGGFVAKYMGDGVLVYLGIPKPMRTTQSVPCGRGWSWWPRSGLKTHAPLQTCGASQRDS